MYTYLHVDVPVFLYKAVMKFKAINPNLHPKLQRFCYTLHFCSTPFKITIFYLNGVKSSVNTITVQQARSSRPR